MSATEKPNISHETTSSTPSLTISATIAQVVKKMFAHLSLWKRRYMNSAQSRIPTQDLRSAYRAVANFGATGVSAAPLHVSSTATTLKRRHQRSIEFFLIHLGTSMQKESFNSHTKDGLSPKTSNSDLESRSHGTTFN
ncbi:hypothetical protein RB195_011439 [Necator americanus]|uniref:Uncharacterized protein n=1 Tax=Necator americanus TaxID=51031 RepID=A0ABR1D3R8_NECAM